MLYCVTLTHETEFFFPLWARNNIQLKITSLLLFLVQGVQISTEFLLWELVTWEQSLYKIDIKEQLNTFPPRCLNKYIHRHKHTNKHKKRCLTSLAIRQMQIKSAARYYYTPIRMSQIKEWQHQVLARIWRNWIAQTLLVGM